MRRNFKITIASFTMVSLKLLLIKTVEDIVVFQGIKVFDFDYSYIISCIRNAQVTFVKKPAQLNIISFYKR